MKTVNLLFIVIIIFLGAFSSPKKQIYSNTSVGSRSVIQANAD